MAEQIDSDIEQAQATVALVARLKAEVVALTGENGHLREGWAARGAELEARARELDALKAENATIRAELTRRVRTAQDALAGLVDLGNEYRPAKSHIEDGRPLPRAVLRGPAGPGELAERRPRIVDSLRAAINGD